MQTVLQLRLPEGRGRRRGLRAARSRLLRRLLDTNRHCGDLWAWGLLWQPQGICHQVGSGYDLTILHMYIQSGRDYRRELHRDHRTSRLCLGNWPSVPLQCYLQVCTSQKSEFMYISLLYQGQRRELFPSRRRQFAPRWELNHRPGRDLHVWPGQVQQRQPHPRGPHHHHGSRKCSQDAHGFWPPIGHRHALTVLGINCN